MSGATTVKDRVLVAYAVTAVLPDGTKDVALLHEPQANSAGPRAMSKFMGIHALYVSLVAEVSFRTIWIAHADALARGYVV